MIEPMKQLNKLPSDDVMCAELGTYLGLEKPVPKAVLRRARKDDRFASYVFTCRNRPHLLAKLFNDKRNTAFALPEDTVNQTTAVVEPIKPDAQKQPGNAALIGKAAGAMWQWAKSGFEQVDEETLQKRLTACRNCEHFTEPPNRWLYKVKLHAKSDQRICGVCSCVVANKARLATESCPKPHPDHPELTRWMEPLAV